MSLLIRHTAVWAGSPGLPGYSQFYQEVTGTTSVQAQAGHNAVRGFFAGLSAFIPADISVTVDPVYQLVTVESGEVAGEDSVGSPAPGVAGAFVGGWNRQVGVLVEWLTGRFVNGRRLRGRTYLVPLGDTQQDDGTLPSGTISAIESANTFITGLGLDFGVWHRPIAGAGGLIEPITSSVVRDKAAVMRSRMI